MSSYLKRLVWARISRNVIYPEVKNFIFGGGFNLIVIMRELHKTMGTFMFYNHLQCMLSTKGVSTVI